MPASNARAKITQVGIGLVAAAVVIGATSTGSAHAAPITISNLSCTVTGNIGVTGAPSPPMDPGYTQQTGVVVTAPTDGTITSFTAQLNSFGAQAADLNVYDATSSGPTTLLSSTPITTTDTSASTPADETFTLNQAVTSGNDYFIAILPGAPTSDSNWEMTNDSSAACGAGDTYTSSDGGVTWSTWMQSVLASVTFEPTAPTSPSGSSGSSGSGGSGGGTTNPSGQVKARRVVVTICRVGTHGQPARWPFCGHRVVTVPAAVAATINAGTAITARLVRNGHVRATGMVVASRLRLHHSQPLRRGRYTLVLSWKQAGRKQQFSKTLRIR